MPSSLTPSKLNPNDPPHTTPHGVLILITKITTKFICTFKLTQASWSFSRHKTQWVPALKIHLTAPVEPHSAILLMPLALRPQLTHGAD
jgi:hypothetical protein